MDLYVPELPANVSAEQIQGELGYVQALSYSVLDTDPDYAIRKAHFDKVLSDLYNRLDERMGTSGPPTPSYSASTSMSRKRSLGSLEDVDTPDSKRISLATTPGSASDAALSPFPRMRQQSANDVIDLTMDEPATYQQSPYRASSGFLPVQHSPYSYGNPHPNGHTVPQFGNSFQPGAVDPFPELQHAYQPNNLNPFPGIDPASVLPANAFSQEWMSVDDLAQFLMTPTDPGGGYAFNQQQQQQRPGLAPMSLTPAPISYAPQPVSLAQQLFGDDSDALPGTAADADDVEHLIENIRAEEVQPAEREPTPKAMKSQLMEHQKIALTWLLKMEKGKTKGGLLADGMGLGKTVEAISLILAHPSTTHQCKTTLVIAPVALMRQWEKEIERHVKPNQQLSVYVYHGTGKKADFSMLRKYDVVLTTFGTLTSEFKQKQGWEEALAAQNEVDNPRYQRSSKVKLGLLGRECMWYRVIIDEAQCIKNRNAQVSKAAADLQAKYRLVMTGTPMMNSVDELYPLIRFLQIPPYHVWSKFSYDISKQIRSSDRGRDKAMNRVQALLKSIMLRRGKTTKIDGREICQIPPKHTKQQAVEFSDDEHQMYKAIETRSQVTFNKYLKKGTVNNNYMSILLLLLRLRQLCCHPHLIKDLGVQVSTEDIDEDDLRARAAKLAPGVVKRLLEAEAFECPICLEVDLNPTIIIPCGHNCCGECFQKITDPAQAIRNGSEANAAKCPHCRGPMSKSDITDYKHFCEVHDPNKAPQGDDDDSDSDEDEDDTESAWGFSDEGDDLGGFIVPDDVDDDSEPSDRDRATSGGESSSLPSKKSKGKGKAPAAAKADGKKKLTLAQLKKESIRNKAAKKKYFKRLRKTWVTSAKIEKTLELLSEINSNDPTEKTLIFSQFTSLLDLLEVPLHDRGFRYQRYDGTMSLTERADAVNRFMDDPAEKIMLISLKAGNAGLNLNKASQVIILDPFWNPFIEDQAVDRAHRMPQQREVVVHRILVPETVEDRICALQDKKRGIINTALDENAGKSLSRLGVRELQYLFGLRERAD